MGFSVDSSDFLRGLESAQHRVKAAVELYADTAGKKLEAEAKKSAPWINRTGNARQTIQGGYTWRGDTCVIYVAGNMDYSVFLELCNEKRYATLWPALHKLEPQILRGFERLFDRRA